MAHKDVLSWNLERNARMDHRPLTRLTKHIIEQIDGIVGELFSKRGDLSPASTRRVGSGLRDSPFRSKLSVLRFYQTGVQRGANHMC